MPDVVIENPVLNSPFLEPTRHFQFDDDGITDQIVEGRRTSSYFVPIPKAKKRGGQMSFDTEWTNDRIEENVLVNQIRSRVGQWRQGGYVGVTPTTHRLLTYWTDPDRERKLFFCQIEALETAIYLAEVAAKVGQGWIADELTAANNSSNPGLPRTALKMATGSGKTVVMAMLIAWHTLNKAANPQDARFTDAFLVVTPGITIRDRLQVLKPNDPHNYYRERDLVLPADRERLGQAKIVITNFHAFQQRDRGDGARLTKSLLRQGQTENPFLETPAQVVNRVCRELGATKSSSKQIVVLNDEAHHCYRRRPDGEDVKLTGEERKEAEDRNKEARVWITGVEWVQAKLGLKAVYDLSATPFFLRGSGWPEGTLFPWVVSDFSLVDAIEAGVVKVPRVPVDDDSMTGDLPTYRELWLRVRDDLPKKGRAAYPDQEPTPPGPLEGALRSLYGNYTRHLRAWEERVASGEAAGTPPVFIVVCNNTATSKLVYDWIAGWPKPGPDGVPVAQVGNLPAFRNDDGHGGWLPRQNTILVDSKQLESGEAMSTDFKAAAAREIEEFKAEVRLRFPGRDTDDLTDEDLLREVMNTVGKPGRLGEHVKCVVSVSMLTEGWDANTVTHVLGVRAFGTQLLCEQVVGRALRRMSYVANDQGRFDAEYAEVYGVPFSFIPAAGSAKTPKPGPIPTRVRALESRVAAEITFPRLVGYRYDLGAERLTARFDEDARLALDTRHVPTRTTTKGRIGEEIVHYLHDEGRPRRAAVAFQLAKEVLARFPSAEDQPQPWLFPQVLAIVRRWMDECLTLKDNAYPELLDITDHRNDAVDKIYRSIVRGTADDRTATLKPILRPYDAVGSTRYVDFQTTKPTYATDPAKCHVSHVVADTGTWEQKVAQSLEEMDEVIRYVKNANLDFTIPYSLNGQERQYIPDFLVHLDDGSGPDDPLQLILEVTGEQKKEKEAKRDTTGTLWLPAVNASRTFGRWTFLETTDPWDVHNLVRAHLAHPTAA